MMDLKIIKKNEVYLKIEAQPHVNYELADFFTFEVESAKYMQKTRRYKGWDGKIRLYSPANGEIYCGLIDYLTEWAEKKGYDYVLDEDDFYGHPQETNDLITPEGVASFVQSLHLNHRLSISSNIRMPEIQQTTPIVANCKREILDDLFISKIPC